MKQLIAIVLLNVLSIPLYSQECRDYLIQNGVRTINNGYSVVPDGCIIRSIATDETIEIPFELIQCKDYKMSIISTFDYKAYIRLYDKENGTLLYNNVLNDTAQIMEFQVKRNSDVKAIITLPNLHGKKLVGAFTAKPPRYCVGLKLESMITKR